MTKPPISKVRVLTLEGITLKGKNRIHKHGKTWRVLRADETTEALLIEPLVNHPHYMRWINPQSDEHFKISAERQMTDLQIVYKLALDNNRQRR